MSDARNPDHSQESVCEKGMNHADVMMEPLAIVGMASRLPGGIDNPEQLWRFILNGGDARGTIPQSRYNGDAFFDSSGKPGNATVNAGYFLDHDLTLFDSAAFPLSIPEIEALDPVQRQLLEIVRECLESAGEVVSRDKDVGCFVGTFGEDWQGLRSKDTQDFGPHRMTGSSDFAVSNRISYVYDFRGPSVTIRTACSASLVALHSACQALIQNDCSSAIVAGANIILSPTNTSGLSEVGALSPDASCKSFDASADGYARAEGVAALYVKKLSQAIACKDPVRAVIRSTASNSDGRSASFSTPNPAAHEALMRSAYRKAGLSPEHTAFVELHGTGTAVGDPIEAAAVAKVFGNSGAYIGSIKPNFGHAEGASGLIGVLKGVLALEKQIIPPNIKFTTPNPQIPFEEAKLFVPTSPLPWPHDKKERVSINSFGLGGSNAHVIIESARSMGMEDETSTIPCGHCIPRLLVMSADHPNSLDRAFSNYSNYTQQHANCLEDMLFTINTRREHRQYRAFSLLEEMHLLPASKPAVASKDPLIVFVFTGQGAQYQGMARSLARNSSEFARDLQELDDSLSMLSSPPSWSIKAIIMDSENDSDINSDLAGIVSQPLCTAVQIALINQLRTWGVKPDIVVGHSSGEIAAAYAAGAVSMRDAIALSYHRGQSLPASLRRGGMAAVGMGKSEVEAFLRPGVTIGCENSPSNVTLSGDSETLERIVTAIRAAHPETFVRMLQVDMAYHSYHMKDVSNVYSKALHGMSFGSPKVPYLSTTYGRWLNADDVLDLEYWKTNLESPVLFNTAVHCILQSVNGQAIFLEVGPHSALRAPLRQCFQHFSSASQPVYISALTRGQDSYKSMLTAMGTLYCAGASIDMSALSPAGKVIHDLPGYPFHYEHVWKESRISRSWRSRKHNRHDLLGVPILENNELEPMWRNILRLTDVSWICDHQIGSDIVFPAAAYIAMVSEAIHQLTGISGYKVSGVSILAAMILHEDQSTEIITSLKPRRWTDIQLSRSYDFTISSLSHDKWVTHCRGQVGPLHCELADSTSYVELPRKVRSRQWYAALRRCGLNYGPSFARLEKITCSLDQPSAGGVAPAARNLSGSPYPIHPILIDEAFQLLSVANARGRSRGIFGTYVPTYIEELCVKPTISALSLRVDCNSFENIRGTITGWSNGNTVLSGHGIQMSKLEGLQSDTGCKAPSGARLQWLPLLRLLDPATSLKAETCTNSSDYSFFLRHLAHENPRCKVLEILGDTSAITSSIIESLRSESGIPMFASYTLAGASEEVLRAARTQYDRQLPMKYMNMNEGQCAAEQRLQSAAYDLIIADSLLEPGQPNQMRLMDVAQLLKPQGYLLVHQSRLKHRSDIYIGPDASWKSEVNHDASKPQTLPEHWNSALQQAGLEGQVVLQSPHDCATHVLVVTKPVLDVEDLDRVTLLVPREASRVVCEVVDLLAEHGISADCCTLDQTPLTHSRIISLLDLEQPFLHSIDEETFQLLKSFISGLASQQQLIWLTKSYDPKYALVYGFARTIRFEHGLDFAILEVDTTTCSQLGFLPSFVRKYRQGLERPEARDYEYVVSDGVIKVGRFHWFSISAAMSKLSGSTTDAKLAVGKKGLLQSLAWVPDLLDDKLCDNMIEVEVVAVGMNFKDVLVAMGLVSESTLGIEASGVIIRTGKAVTDVHAGDRVAIAYNGCFTTRKRVPRSNCVRIPDSMSFEDAATLYGVYCTSVLSLMHIARISASSSILIHSACGGIGLSAIQLCRSIGTKIYATVGTDKKRQFLQNTFCIPSENIFSSRDCSFKRHLMHRTDKKGVDVVLNSLSGELLHTSWECVADFGMMVELGRRDIQEHGRLDMVNFSRNRGYHAVDYAQILDEKPDLNLRLMQEVSGLLQAEKISPLAPLKAFEARDIENCFRFFQKGEHIGKVVVRMPNSIGELNVTSSSRQEIKFDPDAAYLLVGGLGGLGRAVSVWMAERGARHLVYLTRSKLDAVRLDTLHELSAMCCTYQIFRGSVIDAADVESAVRAVGRPIRGVLHMAADLRDCNFTHMTYADWRFVTAAKVEGTLNLHDCLLDKALDFFVMFSSHVGLHGWYGQTNYAAGNTFQDAFVQYRHSQGLAASVLDIGAVEDIGMMSENPDLARRMRSTFRYFLPERQLLEALELAILRSQPTAECSQIVSGLRPSVSATNANSNLPWADDARFLVYRSLEEDSSGGACSSSSSSTLSTFLASCSQDPAILRTESARTTLAREILWRICTFLTIRKEEQELLAQANLSELLLSDLGVDSLVAIELKNWWKQRLGIEITVLQILDCGNIGRLSDLAVKGLDTRLGVGGGVV